MSHGWGWLLFLLCPPLLASMLLWRFPAYRRIRYRSLAIYLVVMSLLIWGALRFVAHLAQGRVMPVEVGVVLWFTIGWRLGWTLWARTVGRCGERWLRWARWRRSHGRTVPRRILLIRPARAACTAVIFAPLFLATVLTHRCKIADGRDPRSIFAKPFEHLRIATPDGHELDGWLIPQENADRTLLICHGAGANKGNFVWFLAPFLGQRYNVVFFDFRAHGSSTGRQTTYGIRERRDVLVVVDWLKRERPEHARRIVGLGSSQGAMALALAAAEEPRIDAVILDSPFVSPEALALHHAGKVPVLGPAAARFMLGLMSAVTRTNFFAASAERAVTSLSDRPVFVIHGNEDIGMPAAHAQRLYDAASGPREIWFGPGPHSNIITTVPDEYGRRVLPFLDAHLDNRNPAP